MRKVRRSPPDLDPAMTARIERAKAELKAYFDGGEVGERPHINPDLYKLYRDALLDEFHYKCAFCDRSLRAQIKGDVEHIRPKSGVRDMRGTRVMRRTDSTRRHPGYWWLAYEWKNLVVACRDCNSAHKLERFPVERDYYAECEGEADVALLVHHHEDKDDPIDNFLVNTATGDLILVTTKGTYTVDLFDLNRETMRDERMQALRGVEQNLTTALDRTKIDNVRQASLHALREVEEGVAALSYFCKKYLDECLAQARAVISSVSNLL